MPFLHVHISIEHHSLHVFRMIIEFAAFPKSNILVYIYIYISLFTAKDGAVLLTARHRYTAFAQLPAGCRPDQRITLVVARGLPNNQIIMERPS